MYRLLDYTIFWLILHILFCDQVIVVFALMAILALANPLPEADPQYGHGGYGHGGHHGGGYGHGGYGHGGYGGGYGHGGYGHGGYGGHHHHHHGHHYG